MNEEMIRDILKSTGFSPEIGTIKVRSDGQRGSVTIRGSWRNTYVVYMTVREKLMDANYIVALLDNHFDGFTLSYKPSFVHTLA
jgi:hypothetical protein